jgi:hypothetical protein
VEATIYIKIPVKVTYTIDPGQRGIFDQAPENCQPEYPASVEDKDFSLRQVIGAVNEIINGEDSTIDEELMEIARERSNESD